MILAVDIENTIISVGCLEDDEIQFIERLSSDIKKTSLEYAIELKSIFELYKIESSKIKGVIISSVVPPLADTFRTAIEKLISVKQLVVGPGVKTGLNICMDNPGQVGSDLVVNAVSAIAFYQSPLIVIDMETATTICVIDEKKNYIGGMIIPGVKESLETLVKQTSQLPRIGLGAPKRLIGKNTIESMKSGIVYGTASLLDGMIERIKAELKEEPTILATGEVSKLITPYCNHKIWVDDTLSMRGLKIIFDKNRDEEMK